MKARGTTVKDELTSAWASLVAHVQEQFDKREVMPPGKAGGR
jgi:hypothetical protein